MIVNGIDTEKVGWTGQLPGIAGQSSGPALIIGGARCVWDDLDAIDHARWPGARVAVNDIGAHYHGRIHHWVSLHPDAFFPGFVTYRIRHNYGDRAHVHTHSAKPGPGVEVVWPMPSPGGGSGLYAVFVALLLGHAPIVCAGLPLDGQGHYFDPPGIDESRFGRPDQLVWQWAKEHVFQGRVRSLSGFTRELLGSPALLATPPTPVARAGLARADGDMGLQKATAARVGVAAAGGSA